MRRNVVDLRSDTVTQPTEGMRQAMMAAELGDDVLGDDPTVIALQERVAALLGKEAALFFPSGTMANQAAVILHTTPGSEAVCEAEAHVFHYELAGASRLAGVQLHPVASQGGRLTAAAVEADMAEAQSLGINGTPAFVINGHLVSGALPYEVFAEAVDTLIAEAPIKPASN